LIDQLPVNDQQQFPTTVSSTMVAVGDAATNMPRARTDTREDRPSFLMKSGESSSARREHPDTPVQITSRACRPLRGHR
jgi:hypothetical protein